MASTHLRRELAGIAMMLFAVFLAGALGVLALAELRSGVDVRGSVGWVGWYLARPLVMLVGWPAAALAPLAAAAHALRVFGRLGPSDPAATHGASWMVFFAGMALLLPVAVGLALGLRIGSDHSWAAGLWGGLVAAYWREWFGAMGAWVVLTLAVSALTAATLAWNPIRMVIGRRAETRDATVAPDLSAGAPTTRRRRRKGADAGGDAGSLALALEAPPEEMPAADPTPG